MNSECVCIYAAAAMNACVNKSLFQALENFLFANNEEVTEQPGPLI